MAPSIKFGLIYASILLGIGHRVAAQTSPPTNLPPATAGVFTAQASILIDAPIETAWNVLVNFPDYPKWNPFVRSQVVTNALFVPLEDQTAQENLRLIIEAQIPPLASPVDENTPQNLLHSQVSFENITTIDKNNYRTAWRELMIPAPLLGAERWQALSRFGGQTYYEAREVFSGPVGYVVDGLFAEGLQEGFDGQAAAFKVWAESV